MPLSLLMPAPMTGRSFCLQLFPASSARSLCGGSSVSLRAGGSASGSMQRHWQRLVVGQTHGWHMLSRAQRHGSQPSWFFWISSVQLHASNVWLQTDHRDANKIGRISYIAVIEQQQRCLFVAFYMRSYKNWQQNSDRQHKNWSLIMWIHVENW